jgi:hypothetical protein
MPKKKSKKQVEKEILDAYAELLHIIKDFTDNVKQKRKEKDYKGLIKLTLDAEEVGVYLGNLYDFIGRKIDTEHYYTPKPTPYKGN